MFDSRMKSFTRGRLYTTLAMIAICSLLISSAFASPTTSTKGETIFASSSPVSITCANEFFPCSATWTGNLILIILYAAFLTFGAKVISDGSELLLEILDPGIIGGFVLPVLGGVPDCAIIIVAGAFASKADVLSQLSVGVGTLAGSTIFLLTIPWAASMFLARCDIVDGKAKDKTLTRKWDFVRTGITLEKEVQVTALVMMLTSFSYFIIQGVAFAYIYHGPESEAAAQKEKWFALACFIVCCVSFIAYSIYQVLNSKVQERRMQLAKAEAERNRLLEKWRSRLLDAFDVDKRKAKRDEESQALLGAPDTNTDQSVNRGSATAAASSSFNPAIAAKAFGKWKTKALEKPEAVPVEEKSNIIDVEKEEEEEENEWAGVPKWKIALRAAVTLAFGVALVSFFSDPMVDALTNLGEIWGISAFYLSFVITPLCSNASETISSLIFASRKIGKNTSVTYSQLYGAANLNNTLALGIFVALIFFRGLPWDFSAEVLAIFMTNIVVGIFGLRKTLPAWTAFVVLSIYPLALFLVFALEKWAKWHLSRWHNKRCVRESCFDGYRWCE